ncbi:hypothetical protein ACNKHN_17265 [Shigella flexneri]
MAEWLAEHPQECECNHPAPPCSKGHEFWKRVHTGSSGYFPWLRKNSMMKSWRTIWRTSVYSARPTRGRGTDRHSCKSTRTYRRHSPTRRD